MNILRLTPHFYWPQLASTGWPVKYDAMGGMQTQIYRQSLHMAKEGVQQTVLTLKIPGTPSEWHAAPNLIVRGVRIPCWPFRSRIRGMVDLNLSWFLGVLRDVLSGANRYDIVHAHCSGVHWPLVCGMLTARWLGVPLVLTIHCSINATYHAMSSLDNLMLPLARGIEKRAICHSTKSIVLTRRSQATYRELGFVEADRYCYIPDCLDVAAFQTFGSPEAGDSIRQRFGLPHGKRFITFVGRIAHEKGWRYLVQLALALRAWDFHFIVCGDGNERLTLENEIRRNHLSDIMSVTGFVPIEVVPAVLSLSSLLVMPSLHEEFGGAMIEAMALSKPVIAFDVGGIPEVLDRGRAGCLVPHGDVNAMKTRILELMQNPTLAAEIGERGNRHVMDHFDISSVCSRIQSLYEEVLRL